MSSNSTFCQQSKPDAVGHLEKLDALCDISRILSAGTGRQDGLCRVLDVLDKVFELNHGTITLLAPDGNEVRVEAVHDLSHEKSRTITYRIGEGVTGQVMQTGKAAIVARVSREPLFLNRFERWNVTKQELSFICVPISIGDEVIGTISVDRPFDENKPLDEEVKILDIVANMIANGMRVSREAAIEMLMAYHWPGNVRELENCIERAVRSSTDGVVHSHHLPPTLQTSDSSSAILNGSFKDRVGSFERDLIVDALKRCNGNLTATARDLKTTARIIRHRVKELGIDYKRYTSKRG